MSKQNTKYADNAGGAGGGADNNNDAFLNFGGNNNIGIVNEANMNNLLIITVLTNMNLGFLGNLQNLLNVVLHPNGRITVNDVSVLNNTEDIIELSTDQLNYFLNQPHEEGAPVLLGDIQELQD